MLEEAPLLILSKEKYLYLVLSNLVHSLAFYLFEGVGKNNQYDFIANWEHEIRVEKLLSAEPKKLYPRCINGKRAGPPEGCGGAWGFMELAEEYSLPKIYSKLRAILEKYQSGKANRNHFEQMIEDLEYWINREKVNKQRINEELREYLLTKDQEATI